MDCGVCNTKLFKSSKRWELNGKHCADCGGLFCHRHRRRYVDGSNEAITKNASTYCLDCFSNHYDKNGDPINSVRRNPMDDDLNQAAQWWYEQDG